MCCGSLALSICQVPPPSQSGLSSLSVKQIKDEIVALGGSAEGCCERSDIEDRLRKLRAVCVVMYHWGWVGVNMLVVGSNTVSSR